MELLAVDADEINLPAQMAGRPLCHSVISNTEGTITSYGSDSVAFCDGVYWSKVEDFKATKNII